MSASGQTSWWPYVTFEHKAGPWAICGQVSLRRLLDAFTVQKAERDGYKLHIRRDGNAVKLFTRRGYDNRFPCDCRHRHAGARVAARPSLAPTALPSCLIRPAVPDTTHP